MIQDARLANILQPLGRNSPNMPYGNPSMGADMPSDNSDMDPDLIAMFSQFQPKTDMNQQFNSAIASMPQRGDYQPSRTKAILAALAGLGTAAPSAYSGGAALGFNANIPEGDAITRGIKDEPYNRAIGDWKQKLEPIKEGAQMENTRNINERVAANDIIGRVLQERGIRRQEKKDLLNDEQFRSKLAETQARNDDLAKAAADRIAALERGQDINSKNASERIDAMKRGQDLLAEINKAKYELSAAKNANDLDVANRKIEQYDTRLKQLADALDEAKKPVTKEVETTKTGEEPSFLGKLFGRTAPTTSTTAVTTTSKSGNKAPAGKIHVKRKSDGQTGYVTNPDPAIYDRIE